MRPSENYNEDGKRLFYSALAATAITGGAIGAGYYWLNQKNTGQKEAPAAASPSIVPPVPTISATASSHPSARPATPELTAEQIKAKVLRSLVILEFSSNYTRAFCTGFFIDQKTTVTAKHCPGVKIEDNQIHVEKPYFIGMHTYPSDPKGLANFINNSNEIWFVIPNDAQNSDFAEIKMETTLLADRQPVSIAEKISEHDKYYSVHFIGMVNPQLPLEKWNWRIDEGEYVGTNKEESLGEIKIKMPHIQPGNSGSPVMNKHGEVVGVMVAISKKEKNTAYFAPFTAENKKYMETRK